ncbi:MAG: T9SS type A sorting domain-containing protein [Chitinophagales bacterium]|nr:T9SS type A sorting domain-containing protein [Bacteroidota bacterium]MBP7398549.1 T9SS type A sorting domain-containing protein [Chitinophagales bacterium]MBP9549413.1 T9SS type A sorting domain-containing protein [Chitinophagales bacterium]MBP9703767.1 T9SS type A sorting domain-containing protein [Chitinophagales bacterium]
MKYFIILSIAALMCSNAYPQGYANTWVFGDSAGLNFNVSPPESFESTILTNEAGACISDIYGNLLFYSNGEKVWNRNNEIMPNGNELNLGGITAYGSSYTQGVIILPIPLNSDKYYVFYLTGYLIPEDNFGVEYSIVDMALDSGKGDVTEKNIDLFIEPTTEKLQAVKHANGRDWWLIFRMENIVLSESQFVRFLITPEGIEGPYYQPYGAENEWTYSNFGFYGEMVFSPQGDKLAYTAGTNLDIYNFDRCTGELSDVHTIYNIDPVLTYGCSFSPDGNNIFVSSGCGGNNNLFQYCLKCKESIETTEVNLYHNSGSYCLGQMELGSDGKIYVAVGYNELPNDIFNIKNQNLSVINSPNELGLACDFDTNTVSLGDRRVIYGLPNMPNYNLGALTGSECDTLTSVIQSIESNTISIYPNPANEYIIISGDINANDLLKIYSADGRVVLQEKIYTTNTKVDISKLPSGVYVIQIIEDGWVKYSEKLLKE